MRLQRFLEVGWLGHQLAGKGQANRIHRMYSIAVSPQQLIRKCHAVDDGSRLSERMRGVKNAMERGVLDGECNLELRGSVVLWVSSAWSTHPSSSTASVVLCLNWGG